MSNVPGACFALSTCPCADSECEHRQEIIPELPPKREDRVKGQIYINKKGEKGSWDGNRLRVKHEGKSIKNKYPICYSYDLDGNFIEEIINISTKIKEKELSVTIYKCLRGEYTKNSHGIKSNKLVTSQNKYYFDSKEKADDYFKLQVKQCLKCEKDYNLTDYTFTHHKTVCDECFEDDEKKCPYCNEQKKLKEFHYKKYRDTGLYDKCWECIAIRDKQKIKQYITCKYSQCCNFILTSVTDSTTGGKEIRHCSNYCKQKNHKETRNIKVHSSQEDIFNEIAMGLCSRDKKTYNSEVVITGENIKDKLDIQENKCLYCNVELIITIGNETRYNPCKLSPDRINNTIGYINENVNICCELCNLMRNTMSLDLFIDLVKALQSNEEYVIDLNKYGFTTRKQQIGSAPWRPIYYDEDNKDKIYTHDDCKQIYIQLVKDCHSKCSITGMDAGYFNALDNDSYSGSHFWLSIDRIDNDKSHIDEGNLQLVMGFINRARNSLTMDEFYEEWNKRNFKTKNIKLIFPDDHHENFINNIINGVKLNDVRPYKAYKLSGFKLNTRGKPKQMISNQKEFDELTKEYIGTFTKHTEASKQCSGVKPEKISAVLNPKKNGKKVYQTGGYTFRFVDDMQTF